MNNERDMVKGISELTGLPRPIVHDVMRGFAEYMRNEIAENGEVYVPRVLKAVSHEVKPRSIRDPKTGEIRTYPTSYRLTLRASSYLKNAYKESFNNFDDYDE